MRTTKRFLSPRVLGGRHRQRAWRALSFHIFKEVQMKSPYYQAVDTRTGKVIVKAYHVENLLSVFEFALPAYVDVYEVREKKIM